MEKLLKRFVPMSETMFYILSSLTEERHGYGIMLHVQEITDGRIVLGAGTIYQTLSKLEGEKLIVPTVEIDRKKKYLITDVGRTILNHEAERICNLSKIAKEFLS
jgi:DNA-binding PadR family transcriptional regulator